MKRMIVLLAMSLLIVGCGGAEEGVTQTEQQDGSQASEDRNDPRSTAATSEATSATSADSTRSGGSKNSELPTVTIRASSGQKVKVHVEVADNIMGRYMGLRRRESLPANQGMLFVYSSEQKQLSFTMADTLIPLSIAFIDSERRIIDMQDMKPLDDKPPGYDSSGPAQYALEVNKGFFEKHGVEEGDRVKLPV
jgi:uncharacterized membrane protein (UPF0127 family)